MRTRIGGTLAWTVACFLFSGLGVRAQTPPSGSVDDLARVVWSYFPRAEGKIDAVEGEAVVARMTGPLGLATGMILTVTRTGEPFYHPITGVALGHFEDEVAAFEVQAVHPDRVTGQIVHPKQVAMPGDTVRLPTRIAVALAPEALAREASVARQEEAIMRALDATLSATGRFQVRRYATPTAWDRVQDAAYLIALSVTPPLATSPADAPGVALQMRNTRTGAVIAMLQMTLAASENDSVLERWAHQRLQEPPQLGPASP